MENHSCIIMIIQFLLHVIYARSLEIIKSVIMTSTIIITLIIINIIDSINKVSFFIIVNCFITRKSLFIYRFIETIETKSYHSGCIRALSISMFKFRQY